MPDTLGPYTLLRPLGQGGTAELYLAEDPREPGSPPVVVKRLHPHLRAYEGAIDLFLQEARLALDCCQHPNIVTILDHGSSADGSEQYIAMEFIDGVTLADLMNEHPALGRTQRRGALQIVFDACAALEHVHSRGVVHRDLNPRNLIIDRNGVARLIDFGVAAPEPIDALSEPNRGTWAYMSPEQVKGEAMDRRSDVFSLGVILWELWTGDRLFFRGPTYLTMGAVVDAEIPPVNDPLLGRAIARCLDRDLDARFSDATALLELLRADGPLPDRDCIARLVSGQLG